MLAAALLYHIVFKILRHRFIATFAPSSPILYRNLYYPGLWFILLLTSTLAGPVVRSFFQESLYQFWVQAYQIAFIWLVSLIIRRSIVVVREVLADYLNDEKANNLNSRKLLTQYRMLERIASFIVILLALAFILLTFDSIRQVGVGLLTSAGVLGIVIGFAAQKSIANVVAGIQLAFAQPIRLDDVVIVENEWGRIEEVTLTFVVVKLWDERRLVVPVNYFIEKPFQNWTRQSSELTGAVFIYTDYTVPVEALRTELFRLLEENPLWDRRVKVLQVTDATEQTVQLRALMSAADASQTFDLRCHIREALITFLQKHHPEALPHTRLLLSNPPSHS
ncbi:MAG: mechanosensitive ion channel [Microscillaceae bacterium]|nr:mechanosensitive ion channel [Microscillaceae bacterium]